MIDKTLNANKKQNTIADKKLITMADKVINTNKK